MTDSEDNAPDPIAGLSAAEIARRLEQTQIGKFHTPGGHGFAAEDANTLADRMRGRQAEVIGQSNTLNGADRLVYGVAIQTKYHINAEATVDAAFDLSTGRYRYSGQLLEVPADQYAESVALMEERIREGRVPGVSDPAQADQIVRRGAYTYRQARNVARAGTIDSLVYDAKTQAVTCSYVFAISFVLSFAQARWSGQTNTEAARQALHRALAAGATTYVTGIVTSQFLRTRGAALGTVVMRDGVRVAYGTAAGKAAVERIAQASLGKAVYGAAAMNHVAKLMRSNVMTSAITTVVITTPDFYRAALSRSISWKQLTKNLFVNGATVVSGAAGWVGGAAIGLVGGPLGALVGGIAGALALGTAGGKAAKKVGDLVVEDDAQAMLRLLQASAEELAFDYLLSEPEVDAFTGMMKTRLDAKWLRSMYAAGRGGDRDTLCRAFALRHLEPFCEEIAAARPRLGLPAPETVQPEIDRIADEVAAAGPTVAAD